MRFLRPAFRSAILIGLCAASAWAQSAPPDAGQDAGPKPPRLQFALLVPAGTPLRVALQERVRIQKLDEPVKATVTHSVYAFDQEVIPAGTELVGKITRIDATSKKRRTLALANGDFTPTRTYELAFDTLVLPDGRRIEIGTRVSSGAAEVVRLVSDPEREEKRNAVARAAANAKKQAGDTVRGAIHNIKSPGRVARLKRYLVAQLPFRRQYLEPGTRFNAVLKAPLDFGTATRTNEELAALGTAPAEDSFLEARLSAEVTSATAQAGTPVEAVVTAPLFSPEQKLVFPANSKLFGEVVRAKPARKLHRNGQLRVVFQRIELPDGLAQKLQASLASLEVDRAAGLQMDAEGGTQATDRKTRYLSTAFAVAAAVLASQREVEPGEAPQTNPGAQTAAGGVGMRLVGAVTSLALRSQMFSTVLGAYGAAASVHRNFLSRGRDVNLAVNTPIEINFGKPRPTPEKKDPDP